MSGKVNEGLTHLGLLWLRIFCGVGIAYHGYGKVFGGYMDKVIQGVAGMGFPQPEVFAWAAALSEFVGGILIALGLFTRTAALFVFATMAVAAFVAHKADPLDKKELALAYFAASGALLLMGGGQYSLSSVLFGGKKKSK